jgi:hypothetical protein
MGYEGKGLGIEGQGIVNPIEVVEIPRYLRLGYPSGAWSILQDGFQNFESK